MKSNITFIIGIFFIFSMLTVSPVFGHDDGLTCHSHPAPSHHESAVLDFALTGDDNFLGRGDQLTHSRPRSAPFTSIVHQFNNLIAERPYDFDPTEVRHLRGALSELEQSVSIIQQLLKQPGMSFSEERGEQLLKLARRAYNILWPNNLIPFSNFREAIWNNRTLEMDMTELKKHLISKGIADELIIVLENAAQSC